MSMLAWKNLKNLGSEMPFSGTKSKNLDNKCGAKIGRG